MRNKLVVVAGAVGLFMVADPMFAHHSESMYDKDHPVTLTGTVTAFRFINPHVKIHFEVKDENGSIVKWVAGTSAPQRLYRNGWHKETLKPGDHITITGHPAKDGRKIMNVQRLVGPDGQVLRDVTA